MDGWGKRNTNLVLLYRQLWSCVPSEMVLGTLEGCNPHFKNCPDSWPCPAGFQVMTAGDPKLGRLSNNNEPGKPLQVITESEKCFFGSLKAKCFPQTRVFEYLVPR